MKRKERSRAKLVEGKLGRKEGGVGKTVDEVLKPPFTPLVINLSMAVNMVIIFVNLCIDKLERK